MAEDNSTYNYGVLGAGITPRALDKWAYTPFYKRYTFTGVDQANQAANLMTSDSFRNYWSQGMTNRGIMERTFDRFFPSLQTPETFTGIRVQGNMNLDKITEQRNLGKLDFVTPYQPKYLPSDRELIGMNADGEPLYGMKAGAVNRNKTHWDLRNSAGAQPLEDRALLSVLKYRNPNESGLTRYVLANSPDDTLGLSEELRLHTTRTDTQHIQTQRPARIMFRDGWFGPSIDKADRVMNTNSALEVERDAIIRALNEEKSRGLIMLGDIEPSQDYAYPEPKPRVFAVGTMPSEERRVGKIENTYAKKGQVMGSNQTTTVFGPPEKYARLRTLATNTANVARTGASYGMSALGLYGAIDAGMSVPRRHEAYEKAGNNWLVSQGAAQADAMLNFMSLGAWDSARADDYAINRRFKAGTFSNAGSYRPHPALGNETSVHLDPNRYEYIGHSLEETLAGFPR